MADYTNIAQQRILQLCRLLAGHELNGVSLPSLRAALKLDPAMLTRDLYNAMAAGWVEEVDGTKHYRLTPAIGRLFGVVMRHFDQALEKTEELKRRYGNF